MKTKEINLKNNRSRYFGVRILMIDKDSYDKVVSYFENIAVKKEISERDTFAGKTNYIFDEEEKQVARTNPSRRIIELTKEVKEEVRSKIERIIAGY